MKPALNQNALDQLFFQAHSYNQFTDQAVSEETIEQLYDLLKWGPTSMNTQPARYLFLRTPEAREQLLPALMDSNAEKTRQAPLTVIIASDTEFYEHLQTQFKAYDAAPMFRENNALAEATAFRNSSLQGAYLMLAARALGLDAGAMSGFDPEAVNKTFFPDGQWKVNFIVNLGYGAEGGHHPRGDRLSFEQAAQIL
ncbi:malonic semialdehyde reductase [Marinobacterium stanieri]|uniref:3-hydroxypropanoate dehydrogenase n=1 Tax=Marinobacterium stanieri TaxID=49186 RepID=A0A1N6PBQ4_9GAMM|nr:malonic semialdehyde reductase [Marinobacterium stanieri]SIQ01612.1 3-hydroxypropanoate dehydrogenase [Marinobacterium stanieri]